MKKNILFILLCFAFGMVSAQESTNFSHFSSWNSFTPKVNLNEKWALSSEFHFRRTNFLSNWEQFIVRPTITYKRNATVAYAVGYTFLRNYNFSSFSTPISANEHNVWEQVTLSHTERKYGFKHRFRIEERFIDKIMTNDQGNLETNGNTYSNRFRYRITVSHPLFKISENKPLKLVVFDELWINLSDILEPESFNQNWLYAGISLPINKNTNIGLGYHHIGLKTSTNFISNDILATGISLVL